ncbi:MAG: hypothetical protein IPI06_05630 [Gammaproteobacteria bacterium]|nr:hypothetical protein [Gammaproteobacteria bacterium]
MNELQFLRNQLGLEDRHFEDVRRVCEAGIAAGFEQTRLDELCRTGVRYLCVVGERIGQREHAHVALLRARLAPDDAPSRGIVSELESAARARGLVLAALARALEHRRADELSAVEFLATCREQFAALDAPHTRRPHMIGHLLDRHYRMADWRHAAHIDADTILDERERYGRVRAKLPRSLELGSGGPAR